MAKESRALERIALIGMAGALGALSRYGLQQLTAELLGRPTVLGTFVVNVSGSLVIGVILGLSEERALIDWWQSWRTVVATGFLGAFTTFSTLMLDSVGRLEAGDFPTFAANLAGSVAVGLVACYAGLHLGRAL
jgi:CrcB protein